MDALKTLYILGKFLDIFSKKKRSYLQFIICKKNHHLRRDTAIAKPVIG